MDCHMTAKLNICKRLAESQPDRDGKYASPWKCASPENQAARYQSRLHLEIKDYSDSSVSLGWLAVSVKAPSA